MEVHDSKVSGPFVAGDTFVVRFDIDATDKNSKERMHMSEVGIYTVKDDKVVRERFLPLAEWGIVGEKGERRQNGPSRPGITAPSWSKV